MGSARQPEERRRAGAIRRLHGGGNGTHGVDRDHLRIGVHVRTGGSGALRYLFLIASSAPISILRRAATPDVGRSIQHAQSRGRSGKSLRRIRAAGSRRGFEPVSAETQPVSGRLRAQISDIEKSSSRDSPPDSRPSAEGARNSSPETRLLAANLRKCRLFAECGY
jgi:hypothetical protein